MTLQELNSLITQLLTRNGSDRIDGDDIRSALLAIVAYFSTQLADIIPDWTNTLTFETDGTGAGKFCTFPDTNGKKRIFETKVAGNINNPPPDSPLVSENTFWREVSASAAAAIPEWTAGIFGSGLIIVYHNHSTAGRGLYILIEAARPFSSTNIEAEITAGKWAYIGSAATFDNALKLGVDGIVRWEGPLKKNTVIEGGPNDEDRYSLTIGTTERRLQNFFIRVADIMEAIIPASGGWRSVVGTAQVAINNAGISLFNDDAITFGKQGDADSALEVINRSNDDEPISPQVRVNRPFVPMEVVDSDTMQVLIAQAEAGKIRTGALVYYNNPMQVGGLLVNINGGWTTIQPYVNNYNLSQPGTYAGNSYQQRSHIELQDYVQPRDRLTQRFVVELTEADSSQIGVRYQWFPSVGGIPAIENNDLVIMNTNSPGIYIVEVNVEIGTIASGNLVPWTQYITVKITGAADKNAAGFGTFTYPINEGQATGIASIQLMLKSSASLVNCLRCIYEDQSLFREFITVQ